MILVFIVHWIFFPMTLIIEHSRNPWIYERRYLVVGTEGDINIINNNLITVVTVVTSSQVGLNASLVGKHIGCNANRGAKILIMVLIHISWQRLNNL